MASDAEGDDKTSDSTNSSSSSCCCCCASPLEQNNDSKEAKTEPETGGNDDEMKKEIVDENSDSDEENEAKAKPGRDENPALKNNSKDLSIVVDIHILATIFEFPYISRDENTMFEMETEEFQMCKKCDSVLSKLYPMYITFTELIKQEGKIWKTLQKIGKEQEPILPMLIYRNDDENDNDTVELDDGVSRGSTDVNVGSSTRKAGTRRPRKVTPKRFDMCLTESETEELEAEQNRVPYKRKQKKKQEPKRKRVKYSSDEIAQDNTFDEWTEPGDNDDDNVSITSSVDPDNAFSPAPSNNRSRSSKIEGRSNTLIFRGSSKAGAGKTKNFKSFVEGVHKKAKAKADAKAKKRGRPPKKPSEKKPAEEKPKKPKVRKPDTRKDRVRIRKSRQELMEELKGDPTRTCDVCGKFFLFPRLMNNHRITVHEGKKPFECKQCGKGFTQNFVLKKHLCDYSQLPEAEREFLFLERENKLKCFICEVCGQRFKTNAHLAVHKQNHREDRPFKCQQCPKTFRRNDHLGKHYKAVHTDGQRFVCSICGQTFKIRSSMRAHEKRHVLPKETHVCTVCGKSFESILAVKRHQVTHEDSLAFQCEVCGKRFKTKDYLGQHLRKGKSCKPGMLAARESQSGGQNPNPEKAVQENPAALSLGEPSAASTASAALSPEHTDSFASDPLRAPEPVPIAGPPIGHPLTRMMEYAYGLFDNRSSITEL